MEEWIESLKAIPSPPLHEPLKAISAPLLRSAKFRPPWGGCGVSIKLPGIGNWIFYKDARGGLRSLGPRVHGVNLGLLAQEKGYERVLFWALYHSIFLESKEDSLRQIKTLLVA